MLTKNFTQISGHRVFEGIVRDEDYKFEGFEALHAHEEGYFWFVARKELIFKTMRKFVPKSAKLIEVGAGTGNVAKFLQERGFADVAVGEMHLKALDFARDYGLRTRYCFDLLDAPFEDEFDCVCAFDVLEHLENDDLAVQNIAKMLKNGTSSEINSRKSLNGNERERERDGAGLLIISVPAMMSLWNAHDVDVGHKRRYDRRNLRALLERNGFEILKMHYFFIALTPLLLLRRILHPAKPRQVPKGDTIPRTNFFVNKILLFILRLENAILPYFPKLFGGSLICVARKKICTKNSQKS